MESYYSMHNGVKTYSIRTTLFKSWFSSDGALRAALGWLNRHELLDLREAAEQSDTLGLEAATIFEKRMGSGGERTNTRIIRFRDPAAVRA